jgi:hypothetical protein
VSSMSQLYLVHDELLEVRGEASSSSSSRRPTAKSSPKSSPAAAKPAAAESVAAPQEQGRKGAAPAQPVESPEHKAERLLARMGVEAAQQPPAAPNSPFKGTAAEKRVAKQHAHRWAVDTYTRELKKESGDPTKRTIRNVSGAALRAYGFGVIKKMKVADMRRALAPHAAQFSHAQAQDTGPFLTARLLLCLSFEAGFGQLPKLWIAAKGDKGVRQALAAEGSKFPLAKLTAEQRGPAAAIIKYWGEQVAREEQEAVGELPDEDPDSEINVAVRALDALFGSTATTNTTTPANTAPQPSDEPPAAPTPVVIPERRRSKRARTAKTISHAVLGGGSTK